MRKISHFLVVGAFVGLAGCGLRVDPFLETEVEGTDFNAYLAREYQRRTDVEVNVDQNWVHADRIASKGAWAAKGNSVEPWIAADYNVTTTDVPELDKARDRLMAALNNGGRTQAPEACAKSQVYYDGWVEQAHDNDWGVTMHGPVQPDYVAAERTAFYEIIPLCEGGRAPAPVADPAVEAKISNFTIYFGFNSSDLTDAAKAIVQEIASFVGELKNPSVVVRGHTDSSGGSSYNLALSELRTKSVESALSSGGVGSVAGTWAGENEPAVPTADNIREPLNRRAVVTISSE
jgi:outer membrane protein OmpA-like peptidoglycan-associated protein